jgi:hypothetical protein
VNHEALRAAHRDLLKTAGTLLVAAQVCVEQVIAQMERDNRELSENGTFEKVYFIRNDVWDAMTVVKDLLSSGRCVR